MSDHDRLQQTMRMLAEWLCSGQGSHRLTVQESMTRGEFFVRLEVGDLGHGACVWWGRGDSPEAAMRGALDAAVREPTGAPR